MKSLIRLLNIAVVIVLGLGVGCASTQERQLTSSAAVPAAEGTVKLSTGENRNTEMELEVRHMASPERVSPLATTYVVWARPTVGLAKEHNLGALRVDEKLTGKLETVVPFQEFDIIITSEPSAQVTEPTGAPLMWTKVVRAE